MINRVEDVHKIRDLANKEVSFCLKTTKGVIKSTGYLYRDIENNYYLVNNIIELSGVWPLNFKELFPMYKCSWLMNTIYDRKHIFNLESIDVSGGSPKGSVLDNPLSYSHQKLLGRSKFLIID